MLEICISIVLISWFSISVIAQVPKKPFWFDKLEGLDSLALIPRWTFFAPNPGVHDYHLLYRDMYPDGSVSKWFEVETTDIRRKFSCVWNPHKRDKKILSDIIISLSSLSPTFRHDSKLLMLSMPYLVLLHFVMNLPRPDEATHRQILLVQKQGFVVKELPQPLMKSRFHAFSDLRGQHAR